MKQKMSFRLDVDNETSKEPTLAEMTAKAVELLGGSDQGFVLFVESALVDKVLDNLLIWGCPLLADIIYGEPLKPG